MRRRAPSNSAARCRRPEVLSAPAVAAVYRTRVRSCAKRTRSAFCGKRYRQRAFLPEPPWLPWGPGCRAGQGRQSKKQRQRSETKPDKEMLAHRLMRGLKLPVSPIVNEFDGDADSGNLAVPASGETKPEGGADSGTGGGGKHSAGSVLRRNEGPMPKRVGAVS